MLNGKYAIAMMGSLLADPGRAAILMALLEDRSLSAGELARVAGVSAQSASAHLAKLSSGGLVQVRSEGRCRYYRLRDAKVAFALEALGAISTVRTAKPEVLPRADAQMMLVRSCYDHMAGRIAVMLTRHMEEERLITAENRRDYRVTTQGKEWFAGFGIDVNELRSSRRAFARRCLDWTERQPHLAGAVGSALMKHFLDEGWLAWMRETRALRVTERGMKCFAKLGLQYEMSV
ncbi:MAG TPA: winged helix-turn-helix domain-containing protein [Candidatus Angelobacter sp.]|jgi:DNA-binding transcriptional ArsR family regulator